MTLCLAQGNGGAALDKLGTYFWRFVGMNRAIFTNLLGATLAFAPSTYAAGVEV